MGGCMNALGDAPLLLCVSAKQHLLGLHVDGKIFLPSYNEGVLGAKCLYSFFYRFPVHFFRGMITIDVLITKTHVAVDICNVG